MIESLIGMTALIVAVGMGAVSAVGGHAAIKGISYLFDLLGKKK